MNFSHLSLKCYPTRANDHLKINNIQTKTKQNNTRHELTLFLSGCLGVYKRLLKHSLWLLPFLTSLPPEVEAESLLLRHHAL